MSTANITFEYSDNREAAIVAKMLEVDNRVAPKKIRIETVAKGKTVITRAEHERLNTLFATVDDLIFTERLISSLIEVQK
ncbi:MAG: KEOPS complex subunit Pcc1 [Candidatus Hydrothermarchaeaceae archaeon]